MKVFLKRYQSNDQGTFGRITAGDFMAYSGELPDRQNISNFSCIPAGTYQCKWTYSSRFKRMMYLVDGVPNRAGIRIHAANFMGDDSKGWKRQLNGCISLGEKVGVMDGQTALLISKPAIRKFENLMNGQDFELEIS